MFLIAFADSAAGAYDASPKLLTWIVLIGTQGAIAGFSFALVTGMLSQTHQENRLREWPYALAISVCVICLLLLATGVAPSLFKRKWQAPLGAQHDFIIIVLTVAFSAPSILAVFTMWSTALGIRRGAGAPALENVFRLNVARARLRNLLWLMSLQIGAATLSTGALRAWIIDTDANAAKAFPRELVLAHGGYFAVILALCFIPAYTHIQRVGESCRDFGLSALGGLETKTWLAHHQELSTQYGLDANPADIFRDTVAIATPILTSILSFSLPGG
ncbi:hypothetical protein HI113_10710 [Corallococcus exiguus]|uniref:hypothetical protein n=1 Tax=Corallococcus exiguus TaxID=83462 RepID=UPI001474D85A|nr:hypothetical protein [Corallococcus exiguus]NNB94374.1 hypothetical protein [Corallococcus exiguus]